MLTQIRSLLQFPQRLLKVLGAFLSTPAHLRKVMRAMEELAREAPDKAKDVLSAAATRIVMGPEVTEIHLSGRWLKAQIFAEAP